MAYTPFTCNSSLSLSPRKQNGMLTRSRRTHKKAMRRAFFAASHGFFQYFAFLLIPEADRSGARHPRCDPLTETTLLSFRRMCAASLHEEKPIHVRATDRACTGRCISLIDISADLTFPALPYEACFLLILLLRLPRSEDKIHVLCDPRVDLAVHVVVPLRVHDGSILPSRAILFISLMVFLWLSPSL